MALSKAGPRLILMAMPDPATRQKLADALERTGLKRQLGAAMFAPECWHQSLSVPLDETDGAAEILLQVGASITAAPFCLSLDRLGSKGESEPIHWAFRSARKPEGLAVLLESIRSALLARGIGGQTGHTAHLTISYRAPTTLPTVWIPPVHWTIDQFMLVRGTGEPYRYEVLRRWALAREPVSAGGQLVLL